VGPLGRAEVGEPGAGGAVVPEGAVPLVRPVGLADGEAGDAQRLVAVRVQGPGDVEEPVDYPCHGFILEYSAKEMERSPGVIRGDVKILLIAKPLADAGVVPEAQDVLIDSAGKHYTVITAKTDTAVAKWVCQSRGR
jgi:hypothetical protein